MEYLMDNNPVAVYKAMRQANQVMASSNLPFIPCKQKSTADYNTVEGDSATNVAKFIKRDMLERMHHRDEDISFKLSPYKNRIPVAEAYNSSLGYKAINQAQNSMRNEGQK